MTNPKKLLADASPRPWRENTDAPVPSVDCVDDEVGARWDVAHIINEGTDAAIIVYAVNRLERYEALREAVRTYSVDKTFAAYGAMVEALVALENDND